MSSSNKLGSTPTPLFGLKSKFTFSIQYSERKQKIKEDMVSCNWNCGPNGINTVQIVSCSVCITIFYQILISLTGLFTLGLVIVVLAATGFQSILYHNLPGQSGDFSLDEIKIWFRSNSSQISTFNEFQTFFGNAWIWFIAFPKNARNSLHQKY